MIANFPENDEHLCVVNFGQVLEMYRKMYRHVLENVQANVQEKTNFFVLPNSGLRPVPLSSVRRGEANDSKFSRK